MKSFPSRTRPRRGLPLKILSALILLCAGWFAARAQNPTPEPRREQLLNGLKILLFNRPGDDKILIKLRLHSGAAFDLAGKEGLMRTLAEAMLDQQTRAYVTDELDGRAEVTTDYDSINITLAGRATDFARLLELVRIAVTNPPLTPEAVERARAAQLKTLGETSSPSDTADRAVAARLFGAHPYARATAGTPESLARVQRSDLLLVRDRFLHPDNATLVIVGGFDQRAVMRSLRQSLGGWTKSDGKVPATFRLPDAPDARTLVINRASATDTQLRLALRGLARTDRDAPAALLLATVARERWLKAVPELKDAFVRHEAFRDGGVFRMGAAATTPAVAAKAIESARAILQDLSTNAPSAAELESARRAVAAALNAGAQDIEALTNAWLDEQSYNTRAATRSELARAAAAFAPAEVQRVGARLFLHTPSAVVAVGDAAQLRAELARVGAVEVFGEAAAKPEAAPQTKPQQPALQLKRP